MGFDYSLLVLSLSVCRTFMIGSLESIFPLLHPCESLLVSCSLCLLFPTTCPLVNVSPYAIE